MATANQLALEAAVGPIPNVYVLSDVIDARVAAGPGGVGAVSSVAGKTGAVTLVVADVSGAAPLASPTFTGTPTVPNYAVLASPAFTGTPTAPTASAGTSTTQVATTAFVATSFTTIKTPRIVTAAGAVTMTATDGLVIVNKTSGAATTVNLEASPATGATHRIKDGKGDAATNNITVVPAAGTIDGAANYVISANRGVVRLEYSGVEWVVI